MSVQILNFDMQNKEIGGLQFVSHLEILPEKDRDKLLTYKEVRDIIKSQEGGICI